MKIQWWRFEIFNYTTILINYINIYLEDTKIHENNAKSSKVVLIQYKRNFLETGIYFEHNSYGLRKQTHGNSFLREIEL